MIVRRLRLPGWAGLLCGLVACGEGPSPSRMARMSDSRRAEARADLARPKTSAVSLLADSAAADAAALAGLPPRLRDDLDIRPLLSERALRDSTRAYCQPLSDSTSRAARKRLRGQWPAGRAAVLFVRADRASGALDRVELVRRTAEGGQRGYIWDRAADETKAVEWPQGGGTPETYGLPEGTPAPRALRGLGRLLLVLPCTGAQPSPG